MTIADIQKIAAEAVANALRLTQTADAPAPVKPVKPASDALREKRLAALAKARAAKQAKAKAAPADKPAAKPTKPAAESAKSDDDVIVKAGGVEVVAYDGGVILRPVGRRRGVAFRKGDWKMFVSFVESFRKGEDMSAIGAAVKARIV